MRHFLILLLAAVMAASVTTPVRAQWALAAGAAFPGGVHEARGAASVGWRTELGQSLGSEIRGSSAGASWTLRSTPHRPWFGIGLRPAVGAGLDLESPGRNALVRVGGFHVEGSFAFALPEGSAIELTGRWVQRGEHAPRGPEGFASRYAEVTLGFVFTPRW